MSQPTIRKGSKGSSVRLCQQRLLAKGFPVAVDGIFGTWTEAAVEQFQASCGVEVDGEVGPTTWSMLMSMGAAHTPSDVVAEQKAVLLGLVPAGTPSQVRAVLHAAIQKLGCKELPEGSNGGPEIADIVEGFGGDGRPPSAYYLHWKVTDKTILQAMPPWCALFVCYALKEGLGASSWKDIPFGGWFGGVSQIEDWGKKTNRWMAPVPVVVSPGALFTISRGQSGSDVAQAPRAGHVGFVVCDNGDGSVTTIEGNVSNQVGYHKRKKSALRGVVTWW